MKRFLICSNDHVKDKKNILLFTDAYNKYDALEMIRDYCEQYIRNIVGNIQIQYFNEYEKNRPYGYFILKPLNDNHKLIVCHKYINKGYIYNSVRIDKLITFSLVEVVQNNIIEANPDNDDFEFDENYDFVMCELNNINNNENIIDENNN